MGYIENNTNEETNAEAAAVQTEEAKPVMTKAQKKKMLAQQKQMSQMFKRYRDFQQKQLTKTMTKVRVLAASLSKEDFNALKDICTIRVAEVKDADGNVTTPASEQVNWNALLAEGKNAIILNREQRILSGKRKRSSGRSSKRKSHSGAVSFLNARSAQASTEEQVK